MMRITFIQPLNPSAEMYVNPLELQRFAGYTLEHERQSWRVNFVDLNTQPRRMPTDLNDVLSNSDVLCIGTPAGCVDYLRQLPLDAFLREGGSIIFVGETVTDGLTEDFLRQFHVPGYPIFSFVGRTEGEFGSLIATLQYGDEAIEKLTNVHFIDEDGLYRKGPELKLSPNAQASRPYFPSDIVMEMQARGLFVLLDGLTRGCEHHCNYCRVNNSSQTTGKVQDLATSTATLMIDVSRAMNRDTYVQFADENFFGGQTGAERSNRLKRIRQLAQELKSLNYSGMIGVDTRADTVVDLKEDAEFAKERATAWQELAGAGLRYAYLGIESLSKTQVKRYSKALDLRGIPPALQFLKRINVAYTVGLIVLDPLVTLEEIDSTASFIEKHELYGNIASLLKEMRVAVRNPYYTGLTKRRLQPDQVVSNFVHLNRETVCYQDARVASVLPITRLIHELFSLNGYRHSDLSAMRAFGRYPDSGALAQIPWLVGKMEVTIWKYLISDQISPFHIKKASTLSICHQTVSSIATILANDLRDYPHIEPQQEAIRRYYVRVFDRISNRLPALIATAA